MDWLSEAEKTMLLNIVASYQDAIAKRRDVATFDLAQAQRQRRAFQKVQYISVPERSLDENDDYIVTIKVRIQNGDPEWERLNSFANRLRSDYEKAQQESTERSKQVFESLWSHPDPPLQ